MNKEPALSESEHEHGRRSPHSPFANEFLQSAITLHGDNNNLQTISIDLKPPPRDCSKAAYDPRASMPSTRYQQVLAQSPPTSPKPPVPKT